MAPRETDVNAAVNRSLAHPSNAFARRLFLGSIAIAGTALYVASFQLAPGAAELLDPALRMGVSAGLSWIGFGVLLLVLSRRTTIGGWADICLSTMTVGILVMSLGVLANVSARLVFGRLGGDPRTISGLASIHVAILLGADVAMGAWFTSRAAPRHLSTTGALLAWIFGLNAIFAVLMAVLT